MVTFFIASNVGDSVLSSDTEVGVSPEPTGTPAVALGAVGLSPAHAMASVIVALRHNKPTRRRLKRGEILLMVRRMIDLRGIDEVRTPTDVVTGGSIAATYHHSTGGDIDICPLTKM